MATQVPQQDELVQEEHVNDQSAGDISADDLWAEIDQKARQYFNLSAAEFAQLYRQGALADSFAVAELSFLLRCIDDSFIPA